ncbi:gag-polypeptide of LTR copia-type [Sesbania bispinosa]|nr:gag-polypeptide of LTR copia-type [Sesbania bispinosa]
MSSLNDANIPQPDPNGYVDGTLPCPTKFLVTAASNINPAYNHWIRQDQLIVHALISSVDPTLTTMLGAVQTPKDVWDILSTMYANKSRSRILSLKDKLSHLTKGDQSISTYLQQIKVLSEELSIIHQPLDNIDFVLYTLNGLNSYFREVVAAIRAHESPISFEELHDKLVDFETYLHKTESTQAPLVPTTNAIQRQMISFSKAIGSHQTFQNRQQ